MDRRTAVLALLAMPLGYFRAYRADAADKLGTGYLRIPLDQWTGIEVQYKGRTVKLSPAEIFNTLQGVTHGDDK